MDFDNIPYIELLKLAKLHGIKTRKAVLIRAKLKKLDLSSGTSLDHVPYQPSDHSSQSPIIETSATVHSSSPKFTPSNQPSISRVESSSSNRRKSSSTRRRPRSSPTQLNRTYSLEDVSDDPDCNKENHAIDAADQNRPKGSTPTASSYRHECRPSAQSPRIPLQPTTPQSSSATKRLHPAERQKQQQQKSSSGSRRPPFASPVFSRSRPNRTSSSNQPRLTLSSTSMPSKIQSSQSTIGRNSLLCRIAATVKISHDNKPPSRSGIPPPSTNISSTAVKTSGLTRWILARRATTASTTGKGSGRVRTTSSSLTVNGDSNASSGAIVSVFDRLSVPKRSVTATGSRPPANVASLTSTTSTNRTSRAGGSNVSSTSISKATVKRSHTTATSIKPALTAFDRRKAYAASLLVRKQSFKTTSGSGDDSRPPSAKRRATSVRSA